MVDDAHAERLGLALQIPPDASHPQDTKHFALWIVAEDGLRLTAPLPLTEGLHARVEVPQSPDDQEHVDVGGGVVDGRGDIGDADRRGSSAAGVYVDLVVSGAFERER